jgi:hypothetical protein
VRDPATQVASAARTEYREAKRRRIEGVTPLPGERVGPYFHPEYWQRQRELAQSLALARTRLGQANASAQAQRQSSNSYALAQQQ